MMNLKTDIARQLERRRTQIGMPRKTIAGRAGVSVPTVHRILSGKELNPQLHNLDAIARVLGVVVTLVARLSVEPIEDAFQFRKKQATEKAKQVVKMVQGTMGLEAQGVSPSVLDQMLEQTVCELLAGSPRRLWSE